MKYRIFKVLSILIPICLISIGFTGFMPTIGLNVALAFMSLLSGVGSFIGLVFFTIEYISNDDWEE